MSMKRLHFCLIGIVISLSACTRPESDRTTLSISIPSKMSSQSVSGAALSHSVGMLTATPSPTPAPTDALVHVVINISGGGLAAPILLTRSLRDGSSSSALQTEFEFDVPQGEGRLVQVLAVYEKVSGGMGFYYGDETNASMKSATVKLPIKVVDVGTTAPIVSGTIWGRYFTDATSGPTGELSIKYSPGGGKPSLIVEKSIIANGWFQALALTGAKLEYVTDSGQVLFGGPVSLDDALFLPSAGTKNVVRVSIPAHDRNESWSGTDQWMPDEAQVLVYGWFGDSTPAAARAVCRPDTFAPLTKIGQASSNASTIARTGLVGQLNATIPTASALANRTTPLSSFYVNGGDNSPSGCNGPAPMPVEYADKITFAPASLDGNGKDGAAAFYGVYKNLGTTYRAPFVLAPAAGGLQVDLELLPETSSLFDKFLVFKRVGGGFNGDAENLSCRALVSAGAADSGGFLPATDTNQSPSTYNSTTGQIQIRVSMTSQDFIDQTNLVICGSKGGKPYDRALLIRSDWLNQVNSVASKLAFQAVGAVEMNTCQVMSISRANALDNLVGGPSPLTVSVNASGDGYIYQNSDCSSTGETALSVTIPANSSSMNFGYRSSTGSSYAFSATASGLSGASLAGVLVDWTQMSRLQMNLSESSFSLNYCQPLELKAVNTAGTTITAESGAVSLSVLPSNGGLLFYTDSACSTPLTGSPALVSGVASIYVKGTATGAYQLTGTRLSQQSAQISDLRYLQIQPLTVATKLSASITSQLRTGSCTELQLQTFDSYNIARPVTGTFNLNATIAGAAYFHQNSDCSDGGAMTTTTVSFSNQSSKSIYLRTGHNLPTAQTLNFMASRQLTMPSTESALFAQASFPVDSIMALVSFSGSGLAGTTLGFPNSASPVVMTLTATNTSVIPVMMVSRPLTGPHLAAFSTSPDSCHGQTLNASSNCSVAVNWAPGTGAMQATYEVELHVGTWQVVVPFTLSGFGLN